MTSIVSARDLSKVYNTEGARVLALDHVTLDIAPKQFTAIMGPSGCGKSTLLHLLACLDTPSYGEVVIAGQSTKTLDDNALTLLRRRHIGFIFQSFNLIPTLTAADNILLPLRLADCEVDTAWYNTVVEALDLTGRLTHTPAHLSGGQIQRVAVARALLMRPTLIVADEPTGNLDSEASRDVLALLRRAVDQFDQSVLMVTHDVQAAALADRVLLMRDGRIEADLAHPSVAELQAGQTR